MDTTEHLDDTLKGVGQCEELGKKKREQKDN